MGFLLYFLGFIIELVSKELNSLAAILHVYAGGLSFMKLKKILLFKKKGKYFYTFTHFYSEKSSKKQNNTNLLVWPPIYRTLTSKIKVNSLERVEFFIRLGK